MLHFEHTGSI